jgi:estrogen-related receptor beta like 1
VRCVGWWWRCQIKDALVKIKADVKTFELRIGVVGHTLMQAKLKTGKRISKKGDKDAAGADLDDPEFDEDEPAGRY